MQTRLIPTLFLCVKVVLMDNYMTLLKFNLCLNTTAYRVVCVCVCHISNAIRCNVYLHILAIASSCI